MEGPETASRKQRRGRREPKVGSEQLTIRSTRGRTEIERRQRVYRWSRVQPVLCRSQPARPSGSVSAPRRGWALDAGAGWEVTEGFGSEAVS